MKGNFSISPLWNNSVYKRYSIDRILKIEDFLFAKVDGIYRCQHFFDFDVDNKVFEMLEDKINQGMTFRFSYINDNLYNKLQQWVMLKNFNINILDAWEAPKLRLNKDLCLNDYLLNCCGSQVIRNYKKYQSERNKFDFKDSKNNDVNKLWMDVLKIDLNSWKKREKSDMKSLDREDLQYKDFLLCNENDSFLNVMYLKNEPIAYSLFFKNNETKEWYAVKWGASDVGRNYYAGFHCLFNHLEKLEQLEQLIYLDFWGRRNNTYDSLKNESINRYHVIISKKG